jgi:2-amino-4-deoxychorismate synthase
MQPFALLHRDGADHVEVLTGDVVTVDTLAEIPLEPGRPTLALIPYRQIAERGFECVDDGAPLECLVVSSSSRESKDAFPAAPLTISDGRFDLSDDEYGQIVEQVLQDEIGHGEGANFVIHRVFEAHVDGDPLGAARAAFGRLLAAETGTYWTFLVHTGTRILVGATPERHVSVADWLVMMNPISGTFRNGSGSLIDFLRDRKEIDELYMVLDEELKMMAKVAEHGGQVAGPYLKQMAHLTHTEYLLAGKGSLDVRDVLRETMFAPTVTGSPIENACRVIARHERRGRGYYAGVLALLDHDSAGRQTLDAPILIRTAEISPTGSLRVPVGATLVRHSTAAGEVAETHTKAAGILGALGASASAPISVRPEAESPEVHAALAARNDGLARFWLDSRSPDALVVPSLAGRTVLIVDGEDTFTAMLAHVLKALGLLVTVVPWSSAFDPAEFDLVVVGPGPGDPSDTSDISGLKMAAMRSLTLGLLAAGRPTLGVCLGHEILAVHLGLSLAKRETPYQGLAREVDLFGARCRVGFYSSFAAVASSDTLTSPYGTVSIARDPSDGTVHALRGPTFAGVQFHPESVLSRDGVGVLAALLPPLLSESPRPDVISPATNG